MVYVSVGTRPDGFMASADNFQIEFIEILSR